MLAPIDWVVIGAYLAFALAIGLAMRPGSERGRRAYFLADRSLPWWWAGTSIAATTFAADTPLAVTGIVAERGLSGNWLWLSWILVHAAVVVVFARRWWQADVITDAEFIARRYRGPSAAALRTFRAALYGLVYNVIILGWVLRAMGKIVHPLFRWEEWTPWLHAAVGRVMPEHTALGGPSELITIVMLVLVVTIYSSLGGIRGVVRTDLIQFALGLVGSIWLAVAAWQAVGGRPGLRDGLADLYGPRVGEYTALFPSLEHGWAAAIGLGGFALGAYLLVQAFANVPADGGGYLQQRLSASRSAEDAQKAAGLFVGLQYLVRTWPWFIVALAAIVLVPIGDGPSALDPALTAMVRADRELAYPALMVALLPPGVFGILVVSLLAAFMSTIDTHFNWGASYAVNDIALRVRPDLSDRAQVRLARVAVVAFAVLAVVVATQIDRIDQAWRWVAALGAALGGPTLLRWFWWRVTAVAEFAGGAAGLVAAAVTLRLGIVYERQLLWIAAASLLAMFAAIAVGPRSDEAHARQFADLTAPPGFWPGRSAAASVRGLAVAAGRTLAVVTIVLAGLWIGHHFWFGGSPGSP